MRPTERLRSLAALLAEVRDVIDERVHTPDPPAWSERRGWSSFLLGMDDALLARCEDEPAMALVEHPGTPASLRELAAHIHETTRMPALDARTPSRVLRRASDRKRQQVAALTELVSAWAPTAARIVEYGAGHGHLTRELATALRVRALGLETRGHVVENARALTDSSSVVFEARDALVEPIASDDLLVGLHACGDLGDGLVRLAAEHDAGVLLVPCCPQKIASATREPLSSSGRALGLRFARELLGLANLATLREGGHGSLGVTDRRRARRTLFLLLRDARLAVSPGEEVMGIHRNQLDRPLADLAARAFGQRGRPPPAIEAITNAAERAETELARMRRCAVPRSMLARVLELSLLYDRAALLEERGAPPTVAEVFARDASPRNLAIFRQPTASRRASSS